MRTRTWIFAILIVGGSLLFSALTASAQDLRTGVEQLADRIAKAAPEGKQLRVAVADFPDLQGVTSDLGRYIASRLTTRLAQNREKFFVVERQRLNQVLAELKFSMSDLVDPAKAKQLGKMVGVEAIVVGTVSDLGNQVDIDARMIEIETNRLLLGATVTISKDPTVTALLERGRVAVVTAPSPPEQPPQVAVAPAPQPKALRRFEQAGFVIEFKGCKLSGGTVTCDLTVTNMTEDLREFKLWAHYYDPPSLLYDDLGNEYLAQGVTLGPKSGNRVSHTFAPKVVLPASVKFGGVSPQATEARVLKIGLTGGVLDLRNIPLQK